MNFKEIKKIAEHYGLTVELSDVETRKFLRTAKHRMGKAGWGPVVEVEFSGQWLHLVRTDLTNDVCTGWMVGNTITNWRQKAAKNIYGARIDNNRFAIIDSFSDG